MFLSLLPNKPTLSPAWLERQELRREVKGDGGADSLPEDTTETSKQKKLGSQG